MAIGVFAIVVSAIALAPRPSAAPTFVTKPITRGDVAAKIEATGTVEPLKKVQVGAQVSGRVAAVHVDYNDEVKAGQLLAELDAAPFTAQLEQARAALQSAEAQLKKARVDLSTQEKNHARATALVEGGLTARADLDAAVGARDAATAQVDVASAQVAQAKANVASAQQNVGHTKITAPIDGTVITRSVEPGQTVAASLQAPTLFVIANDLSYMQVTALIDEADVASVSTGAQTTTRVDAYPNDKFDGTVRELRMEATTTNGVVTYPAVIDVANTDRKLRPGMTATVTLTSASAHDVLLVSNAALRFRPDGPAPVGDGPMIFVLVDGSPRPILVEVGVSDDAVTQVTSRGGELAEGAQVIVESKSGVATRGSAGPPGGAPGGAPSGTNGRRGPPRMF